MARTAGSVDPPAHSGPGEFEHREVAVVEAAALEVVFEVYPFAIRVCGCSHNLTPGWLLKWKLYKSYPYSVESNSASGVINALVS